MIGTRNIADAGTASRHRPPSRLGDVLGIVNTTICLAHCLALPLLVSFGAAFMNNPFMDHAFIAIAALAVAAALRSSPKGMMALLMWTSFAVFASAILLEDAHPVFGPIAILASLALVAGHAYHLLAKRTA